MKVLIIGGMGVIGGAITEAAAKKEIDVYVLSRREPFEKWKELPVHYIQGNWRDDSFAKELVSQYFDVIVDTLIFNEKQLLRSAGIVNGYCTQFVYISTDSVYKHPNENLCEDDNIDLEDVKWSYGYNKRMAELCLLSHSSDYKFYWTVIRPTITFGDTRIPVGYSSKRNTFTLADRIIEGKPIIRFDDPESKHALCHTSIFGEAVCELFLKDSAASQCYHISDDKAYTYDEIFAAIEDVIGKKGIYIHFPTEVVRKYSHSLYEEMIYDKDPTFILNNIKIKEMCPDVVFHKDISEAMSSTINYLKAHRDQLGEDSDYNLISDVILLKCIERIKDENERKEVEKYISGFSKEYIRKLNQFDEWRGDGSLNKEHYSKLSKNRQLYFYGNGETAKQILLDLPGIVIKGFTHCKEKEKIVTINGKSYDLINLKNLSENAYIIVASVYYDEIKKDLISEGKEEFSDFISYRYLYP